MLFTFLGYMFIYFQRLLLFFIVPDVSFNIWEWLVVILINSIIYCTSSASLTFLLHTVISNFFTETLFGLLQKIFCCTSIGDIQ